MLETLMALWNQNRRKRARQILLTFLLMCIGTSLLLVLTNKPAESQHQSVQIPGQPTVPVFGSTVIPNTTPTISVTIATQQTPITTTPQPSAVAKSVQPTSIPTTPVNPVPTTTLPCVSTPSNTTSSAASLSSSIQLQQPLTLASSPPSGRGTPTHPLKPLDGGGPIVPVTPIAPIATPVVQNTPGVSSTPSWVHNCNTSNSIIPLADKSTLTLLKADIWLILGTSLLGTALFYACLFLLKRKTT